YERGRSRRAGINGGTRIVSRVECGAARLLTRAARILDGPPSVGPRYCLPVHFNRIGLRIVRGERVMETGTKEASGPLKGFRIVELAMWAAGPMVGGILADWGADIIKIESPDGGDPFRALNLR